tara:strand:- start:40997 stop:42124 length:1128 start_codon:yes stop_codon:yes gene_type:complete
VTVETPLPYIDYEPWDEEVDLAQILSELANLVRDHVYLEREEAMAVVLWVVMTWIHDGLQVAPFLNVTSATKRCGKTTLLEILKSVTFHSILSSGGISSGGLARTIRLARPTLILDEVDTYLKRNPDLRGVINGSQRRSGAVLIRCAAKNYEPEFIDTWCPKVLSGIGELPDTVLDRCITIRMRRRPATHPLKSFRSVHNQSIEQLNRKLARVAEDIALEVEELISRISFPDGLDDRAKDSWAPLLAIAYVAGTELFSIASDVCAAMNSRNGGNLSQAEELLFDLRKIFDGAAANSLPTKHIIEKLVGMENRIWATCCNGGPLTPHKLARELGPFGISPGTVRVGDATLNGYRRVSFEAVWSLWLTSDIPHNPTT